MFFIDDELMLIMIILKICEFLERKINTVDLNKNVKVKIYDKIMFTLTLMCLIV